MHWKNVPPCPPNSSGTSTAIRPSSKNSCNRSLRKTPASSMARTCGASLSRAKRRTEVWKRVSSSLNCVSGLDCARGGINDRCHYNVQEGFYKCRAPATLFSDFSQPPQSPSASPPPPPRPLRNPRTRRPLRRIGPLSESCRTSLASGRFLLAAAPRGEAPDAGLQELPVPQALPEHQVVQAVDVAWRPRRRLLPNMQLKPRNRRAPPLRPRTIHPPTACRPACLAS